MRKWNETRDDVKDGESRANKNPFKTNHQVDAWALIWCPARENSQTTQLGNGSDTVLRILL